MSSAKSVPSFESLLGTEPEVTTSFEQDGFTFDYFLSRHSSKTLLVFFPSALRPEMRRVPSFHRWSWAADMPAYDSFFVSDPTMRLGEEILGGWLLGNEQTWVLKTVIEHTKALQDHFGYENIIFSGSSLGGFCALQAGALAPSLGLKLGSGGVFAENPQINLLTYKFREAIDLLARECFNVATREQIPQQFLERLNAVETMKSANYVPRGRVVVKESDIHHFTDQIPQLAQYLSTLPDQGLEIEVIPNDLDTTGHTPLTMQQMLQRLAIICPL